VVAGVVGVVGTVPNLLMELGMNPIGMKPNGIREGTK